MRANNIVGRGEVDGRPVIVSADDFTIRGGHADGAVHRKTQFGEQMSREYRIPMIRMVDGASGGGSAVAMVEAPMAVPAMTRYGLLHSYKMLDEVPVCSLALGPSVGGGAIRMTNAHFAVIAEDVGQLFVSGPPIVLQGTHENLSKKQLGGAWLQASVGGVDNVGKTEVEAIGLVKRFLSYVGIHPIRRCGRRFFFFYFLLSRNQLITSFHFLPFPFPLPLLPAPIKPLDHAPRPPTRPRPQRPQQNPLHHPAGPLQTLRPTRLPRRNL